MRRIYRKMRVALLSFCVLTAVLSTGCSAEETGQSEISEEVYQLGNQEIQIDLSDRFECTKQSASEIVLDGKVGEIKMEYLGEGISSESFPGCPLQISLPFLTAKAWGMPLTPIGDSHLSLVFFPSTSTAMA